MDVPVQPTSGTHDLWRTCVVIGTSRTIAAIAAQLPSRIRPIGCIPIDGDGQSTTSIAGLPVLGLIDDLPGLHTRRSFSSSIVSIPAGDSATILRIRARLRRLGIVERFVPPLEDLLAQPLTHPFTGIAQGLDMSELIGRRPYGMNRKAVARVIEGKRVLITGAGGSIGSELARIAATFHPALLVLMERSENALFEIDRQIARLFPDVPRRAILHDVVESDATLRHFVELRPHTVFHAAAHKHVPLMEDHPAHALINNLFGTKSVADAALATGCERFVLISTDKAVNPTSIMGATKRLAERYVQFLENQPSGLRRTRCMMVRFGNVLGSACSVLPIWTAQLAEGGPITVTDPRMTRFFMTITEAASLVMQAAALDENSAGGACVLVLDMGEPIRILDLARRFITLHGFEPRLPGLAPAPRLTGREIDIVFTGIRPGEKLHEELAYQAESLRPTPFPGILALTRKDSTIPDTAAMIADLAAVRHSSDRQTVIAAIQNYIPELKLNRAPEPTQKPNSKAVLEVAAP
jgi:FlaA1/EpsC-like NDP-sugar epimerase